MTVQGAHTKTHANVDHIVDVRSITSADSTTDTDYVIELSGTFTLTMHTPADSAEKVLALSNIGTGIITLTTIVDSPIMNPGDCFFVYYNGTEWRSCTDASAYSLGTDIITNDNDIISAGTDSTKWKVKTAFKARFVDWSNVFAPTVVTIDIPITDNIEHSVPIDSTRYVGVQNNNGTPQWVFGPYDEIPNLNTTIVIGGIFTDGDGDVSTVPYPTLGFNYPKTLHEFILHKPGAYSYKISGSEISINPGTRTYNRLQGKWYRFMSYLDSLNPNIGTDVQLSAPTIYTYVETGAYETPLYIDTDNYSNNGVKTALPENSWGVGYIYHWAGTKANYEGMQRGVTYFPSKNDAFHSLGDALPTPHPDMLKAVFTDVMIFKSGCTDFDNSEEFHMLSINKDGIYSTGEPLVAAIQRTGVVDWSDDELIVINGGDNTKFDIGEFRIACVEHDVIDGNPVKFLRTVPPSGGISASGIPASGVATWIGYNWQTEQYIQQPQSFAREDFHSTAQLGRVTHLNKTNIDTAYTFPMVVETDHDHAGYVNAYGTIRIGEGFEVTPNGTNLKFDISAGYAERIGANSLDRNAINFATTPEDIAAQFYIMHRAADNTPVLEGPLVSDMDLTKREDGAGGTVELTNDKYGNAYIMLWPYRDTATIGFGRGSVEYDTLQDAELGHISNRFAEMDGVEGGLLIAAISFQKGITDFETAFNQGLASIVAPTDYGVITTVPGYAQTVTPTYNMNDLGNNGTHYIAGYYEASGVDANLTQASTSVAFGSTNVGYGAHPFIVAGGAGSVDTGQVGLRVVGTSIDDYGVITASDTDVLTDDITTLSTDAYLETKKILGEATFEFYIVSGSPTTYSLDFNYGYVAYEDYGNKDFVLQHFQVELSAKGNDGGFNIIVYKSGATGHTYAATGFVPGGTQLINMYNDYYDGTTRFNQLVNGQPFKYKRFGLSHYINGAAAEGYVISVVTASNNSIKNGTAVVGLKVQST